MDATTGTSDGSQGQDSLYTMALKVVQARRDRICVANLQRTLAIGYKRAGALIERMVDEGVLTRSAS